MNQSKLRLYSLGRAAENLTPGSKTLQVVPIEELFLVDGELKSEPTDLSVTGTDSQGNATKTAITMDNAVEATWFPFHTNRHTAPDVRRGERVLLWRFADRAEFLWSETNLDANLRRLETATYIWNASQDESDNSQSDQNHYYVEVSTHKGTITLSTSKANGEKVAHTVQFNPKEGLFTLQDDIGQVVFVDSMNHLIHLVNADKSEVTLSKQDITVKCSNTLNLIATNTVNLQTKTFNVTADDVKVSASNSVTINTQTAKLTASSAEIDAPTTKVSGITISNGQIQCGQISCSGINSSGPVNAPNIT